MSDDIHSPPFPTELTTPDSLQRLLRTTHDWLFQNEGWFNDEAYRLGAPGDPFINIGRLPDVAEIDSGALMRVSIPSLFRTWMTLRAVRERWDHIFRRFEEDWDSDVCVKLRLFCFKAAAVALEHAFLDPETFEAKQHEEEEKHRVHMVETLKTLGVSDNLLKVMGVLSNDEEGGQIDFDRLFNPE